MSKGRDDGVNSLAQSSRSWVENPGGGGQKNKVTHWRFRVVNVRAYLYGGSKADV